MKKKFYKKMALKGFIMMCMGWIFGISETIYFGSHWLPESKFEFICDMVAQSFVSAGCALLIYGLSKTTK